jgi:predicted metalloendopeptidase
MIKYLRDSFKALVGESDWLDDSTKNKSLEKLDAIIENDVYPDWILDNQELDKYYKLVNNFYIIYDILNFLFYNFIYLFRKKQRVDPKKAFEGILYLQMILNRNEFVEIHNPVNRTLR